MHAATRMGSVFFLFLVFPFAVLAREVVNFDLAWRYKLYPQLQCSQDSFLYNVSDLECYGLNDIRATTADLCRDACCAQVTCEIWQFTYGAKGVPCKVGISNNCTTTKLKIVGQRREKGIDPSPEASRTPETSEEYDDSSWTIIDVPHDSIIDQPYQQTNEQLEAYLPKNQTWYRKHFNLPLEWKGMSVWLYFEGIFRASSIYLNGKFLQFHDNGYTSFSVRIDNAPSINFGVGKKNENVLAVRCLASGNYGWWYEGSGIYRHVKLVATNKTHFVPNSLHVISNITSPILPHVKGNLRNGTFANIIFDVRANITNDNVTGKPLSAIVRFTMYDTKRRKIGTIDSTKVNLSLGDNLLVQSKLNVKKAEIWSNLRPYLYTLQVELIIDSTVLDSVNVSTGARAAYWNATHGFHLNGIHFDWRGFNDHNQFTGVGIAVPDRINLFQAQTLRAVGGNALRTSYNPTSPTLLDVLDQLGVVVWEETREFGKSNQWIEDFRDMVRRDRNHPSIMVWSICNGAECNIYDWYNISHLFKTVSKEEDPARPVSANMFISNNSNLLDVQGLNHPLGPRLDAFHKQFPAKPLIGSECCRCQSQRGEDDTSQTVFGGFNANCTRTQTTIELSRAYVAGCLVYTVFDHYGEVTTLQWPHVTSSFGVIDLAGFPKSSAYWFRTWWLVNALKVPATTSSVPYNAPMLIDPVKDSTSEDVTNGIIIRIVQHWDERPNAMKHSIQVYTNAPQVELEVNGKSKGVKQINGEGSWGQWDDIVFIPGTLKAYALNIRGDILATQTLKTADIATNVDISVDVPSASTGTGSALVLDGQDTGMVHAAIRDSNGNLDNMASNNITFKIVSGPGRIVGVGNGNPACHEPNQATWRSAYHGLARAIVQVTMDQASPQLHRKRLMQIDRDGGVRTTIVAPGYEQQPLENIVVEASSEGLISSRVTIPVSSSGDYHSIHTVAEKWMEN